jgi:hypothetical protein
MRRESPSPLTRLIPLPLWAVVAVPLALAVLAGLAGMMAGVYIGLSGYDPPGTPGTTPAVAVAPEAKSATKVDPKTYLRDPVNKKAFEAAVMGKSTREVTELLGPPDQVLHNPDLGLEWIYHLNRSPDGKKWTGYFILIVGNDHITAVH